MAKIGITGSRGFLGSALATRLREAGHHIYSYPRPDLEKLYLFGSPSSDIIYRQNLDYCFSETITSFLNAVQFCRDHHIQLIWPSSATVYNKATSYSRCKAACEEIMGGYGGNIIGVRIFAGYGLGEAHKEDYASVIYQFCKQMKQGMRPVIFGDGTQTRNFIYIDDIIDNLLRIETECLPPCLVDIGSEHNPTFNEIVALINQTLGTNIQPIYTSVPANYIPETICSHPSPTKVSLQEGIERIIRSL